MRVLLSSTALVAAMTLLCSSSSIVTAGATSKCASADLTVELRTGTVHGKVEPATPDVRQFLGIPYGEAPVGDLRFAPPRPAGHFGELNATSLPPSCMSYLTGKANVWTELVLQFNAFGLNSSGPVTEDCLTTNVWTPRGASRGAKLPVLIYIYGGSFRTGSSSIPYQIPAQWVQRTKDHIVVSFDYRTNIFGFPNAAGIEDGLQNVGLMDQRLAVEWVRDNIAAFGGDPDRIGLWGQSAGGISVAYYSYLHYEDPIVNSFIMDSGNELLDITSPDSAHSNFTFFAEQFGCGDLSPADELACMRTVDADEIEDFLHAYNDAGTTPTVTFAPVVDDITVFSDYYSRALAGNVSILPTLLGSNTQDGVPFVTYSIDGPNTTVALEVTLDYFFCPSFKSATTRTAAGAPVYRYEYAGNFSNISPVSWLGAWHGAELPLLFGTHSLFRNPSTALENATSVAMQDAWLGLVAGGEAGMAAQGWPVYDVNDGGLVRGFAAGGLAAQTTTVTDWEALCPDSFQP
ncbi:acetylcholinesterase [Xylariales sp. PMI_506]|nr:acetylcholinesterase [Xylariales sp. PMI_506]